jgi:K+-transporting ATPase KdpF subunit
MSILTGIGAVVSACLLTYLLFALLYPEKLG